MFTFFLFVSSLFSFQPDKVQDFLEEKLAQKSDQQVSVLVYMKERADFSAIVNIPDRLERHKAIYNLLKFTAIDSQKDLISWLKNKGLQYESFYITNMIAIENVNRTIVSELSERMDVRKISINPEIENNKSVPSIEAFIKAAISTESNISYVGADKVWTDFGVKGEGIVVAGQDSGVEWDHPALIKQYRGFKPNTVDHNYNWHDAIKKAKPENTCGSNTLVACDDNGHGTHTMGTMVGDDGGNNQIGLAPEAKWIACRNTDDGHGRPQYYLSCFEFFFAPYPLGGDKFRDGEISKAPHVINNSWTCPDEEGCEGDEFIPVLEALEKAGIMVVASASNDGPLCGTIKSAPAHNSEYILSVGALNHATGLIAWFSSRGPSAYDGAIGPSVSAPGVNIRSSVPGKTYEQGLLWSGTSMAGPHVAAQVALMWSANPNLIGDIQKTKEIIFRTARAKTARTSCGEDVNAIPNNTYGYGVIDVFASVKEAIALRKKTRKNSENQR